ncbi:alpha/beta hydrolase [Nocardioides speluncae]|uniref:alpha/beta hydrolase n=1 Tax=Nocardioides speluncae TaxID=2670337 RepID=UPI000D68EC34|nr:alpha/beta hydrolase [Nocardioides speluncae]
MAKATTTNAGPIAEPDVLGTPYTAETILLRPDEEGEVVATLVKRPADSPTGRAVLHVHGYADYFFHTEYAEWWTAQGYDFYALDLRKYGRSIRPHQTPNFVTDVRDYFEELDEAWHRVAERDGHDHVVLSAHSTGGLTMALWADDRKPAAAGMFLNSPWFDLRGSVLLRTVATTVVDQVGARQPKRVLRPEATGAYVQSIHRDYEGEFDFNLDWKPLKSWPIYAGWLRAIRRAHADLHRGLAIDLPVLVLTSARTGAAAKVNEIAHTTDLVLDVKQIRRWSPALGSPHLTLVSIDGAKHDILLSREPVRKQVYAEVGRWLSTYVDEKSSRL